MTTKIDTLKANRDSALRRADDSLKRAAEEYAKVEEIDQTLADDPETSPQDKAEANRNVGHAQRTRTVITGILNAVLPTRTPIDPHLFGPLIKWHADCSDRYGSDLIGLTISRLNKEIHPAMPADMRPLLESFRKLPHDEQERHVAVALPEDWEMAEKEDTGSTIG